MGCSELNENVARVSFGARKDPLHVIERTLSEQIPKTEIMSWFRLPLLGIVVAQMLLMTVSLFAAS